VRFLGDLNQNLVHEIERFFVAYNETKGKKFQILGRFGPDRAASVIENATRNFRRPPRHTTKSRKGVKSKR
jgi:hypothetical protein